MSDRSLAAWFALGAVLGGTAATGTWLVREPPSFASAPDVPQPAGALERAPGEVRATVDTAATTAERRAVPEAPPPADPALGVVAFGAVRDGHGDPVADARPVLEDADARLYRASAGPDGRWTLLGLAPGEYELRLAAEGCLPLAERVTVPAEASWRHDLVVARAATLPVRFEDAEGTALALPRFGRDLASMLAVVATAERPGARVADTGGRIADRSPCGRFASRAQDDLPPDLGPRYQGLLSLSAAPPLWVSVVLRDVVLESRALSGDEDELVFVVDPTGLDALCGTVRVRVVDRETGTPITLGVNLEHMSSTAPVGEVSDEEGTLVFERVPPGTLDLIAWGGGYERLERGLDVPPGGTVDLGTIALGHASPLRVRVVGPDRTPLATGVRASAVRLDLVDGPTDLEQRIGGRLDTDGVLELGHLAPGPTLVRARAEGYALAARLVDTAPGDEVLLQLAPGTPVVLRRDDRASDAAGYVLEDAAGTPLLGGPTLPRETWLAPGTYVLRVLAEGRDVERRPFTVGSERVVVRYGGGR